MLEVSWGALPRAAVPMTSIACSYDSRYRAASSRVLAPSPSMSKEHMPTSGSFALRSSASSMVRPTTNSPPMIRIALRTARRTRGSPAFRVSFLIQPEASDLMDGSSSRMPPVSISPQVEALTNKDSDLPECADQSPVASCSAISRSAVASSGIRSSASAMHMSAIPSWFDSPNSCRKASRKGRSSRRARAPSTSAIATDTARCRSPPVSSRPCSSRVTARSSGHSACSRMACRSGSRTDTGGGLGLAAMGGSFRRWARNYRPGQPRTPRGRIRGRPCRRRPPIPARARRHPGR